MWCDSPSVTPLARVPFLGTTPARMRLSGPIREACCRSCKPLRASSRTCIDRAGMALMKVAAPPVSYVNLQVRWGIAPVLAAAGLCRQHLTCTYTGPVLPLVRGEPPGPTPAPPSVPHACASTGARQAGMRSRRHSWTATGQGMVWTAVPRPVARAGAPLGSPASCLHVSQPTRHVHKQVAPPCQHGAEHPQTFNPPNNQLRHGNTERPFILQASSMRSANEDAQILAPFVRSNRARLDPQPHTCSPLCPKHHYLPRTTQIQALKTDLSNRNHA